MIRGKLIEVENKIVCEKNPCPDSIKTRFLQDTNDPSYKIQLVNSLVNPNSWVFRLDLNNTYTFKGKLWKKQYRVSRNTSGYRTEIGHFEIQSIINSSPLQ